MTTTSRLISVYKGVFSPDNYRDSDGYLYSGNNPDFSNHQTYFSAGTRAQANSRIYSRQTLDELAQEFMQHDEDLRLEEQIYSAAVSAYHVLPSSSASASTRREIRSKSHKGVGSEDSSDTWDPLDPLIKIGSLEVGDGRHGSYAKTHSLGDILISSSKVLRPERREPHHHHHHHGDHDEVIVNGSNDRVHENKRREPHHHHHHGYDHKTVVNGDNDDVHIHERRTPHHHHDHHDHDRHGKTVVNGSNDHVDVHERDVEANSNYDVLSINTYIGCGERCPARFGPSHGKRDAVSDDGYNIQGVPGTIDIMVSKAI